MIEAKKLTRCYGDFTAVDRLSFTVEPGTVLGFLGPNGAGKSTTMKMLTGFLPPTSGTAAIHGHDIVADSLAARRLIGYLPEGAPLYGELGVQAFLDFIAGARGYRGSEAERRVEAALERLQLGEVRHQTIETLSKGFKRRVGLAQAILSDPPVLILDEPTDGLDPNQKQQVRRLIRQEGLLLLTERHQRSRYRDIGLESAQRYQGEQTMVGVNYYANNYIRLGLSYMDGEADNAAGTFPKRRSRC